MTLPGQRDPAGDDDDTVRLNPAKARHRRRLWLVLPALAALAAGAALLLPPGESPPPAAGATSEAGLPELREEAAILAQRGDRLVVRRFAPNPAILVLDFPTLTEQARALNRVAALVEKAGLPRDRVLDDAALDAAERGDGGSAESFYYGHNYRLSELRRFFALADAQRLRLRPEEEGLRALVGRMAADAPGALISLPQPGVEPWLDERARAAILRHELSHGEFFTNPAYAALVWRFWREALSEAERARFRTMLAAQHYDSAQEEVMANEAQAFLFHTPDPRFFEPKDVGMDEARAAALREWFRASLPGGWLRDGARP